jgi:4-amino-4-deoxy-L-arabinose transferase-like glycosyltransferase
MCQPVNKSREVLVVSTLVLATLSFTLPLSDQEAYYWLWSKYLDFGYYDHPPMQAWLTYLSTSIFGDSIFSVRMPAIVLRLVGLLYFYKWSRLYLSESRAAFALLVVLSSFFMFGASLIVLPDSYLFPFAAMTLYYAEKRSFIRCGLSLGLAALAKWTAAIYVPGVMAAMLLTKGKPKTWRGILIVGIISLAIQAPVFYWNKVNNWVSFKFHLSERHASLSQVPIQDILKNTINFISSQIILGFFGVTLLLIWITWALFTKQISLRQLYKSQNNNQSPLWPWILPAFLIFGYSAMKGQLRFYWTAPAFLPLVIAIIMRLPENFKLERFSKIFSKGSHFTLLVVFCALHLPIGAWLKPLTDLYKNYDLRHSPLGDLKGWDEWIKHLEKIEKIPIRDTAFMASDFRLASQASWALRHINPKQSATVMPQKNQFLFFDEPKPEKYANAIMFFDNRYRSTAYFQLYCEEFGEWKELEIKQYNKVIKKIGWVQCNKFIWPK